MDFFETRYFGSAQGRFTSPDSYNIIFEKEKGRNENEREQFFSNYVSQPQIWNKYVYALNNPLRYSDPDGRRPLTAEDQERLKILWTEHHKARTSGDIQLADSIVKGIDEIVKAIDAVPVGTEDPDNLQAVFFAIDNLGNEDYGKSGTVSNGVTTTVGAGENKCNIFCANAYAIGAGVGFDGKGVPTDSTFIGSIFGRKHPPVANDLANKKKAIANFSVETTPALGDIAAFPARVGQGHSSIYTGGGTVIYASTKAVKIQTVRYVQTAGSHSSVTYRRYKP